MVSFCLLLFDSIVSDGEIDRSLIKMKNLLVVLFLGTNRQRHSEENVFSIDQQIIFGELELVTTAHCHSIHGKSSIKRLALKEK